MRIAFHKFLLISLLEQQPKCKSLGLILFYNNNGKSKINAKILHLGHFSNKPIVKQTRARSGWDAITNPHAKVFDPSPSQGHEPGNRMKVLFNMFLSFICVNTHKVWYKNL